MFCANVAVEYKTNIHKYMYVSVRVYTEKITLTNLNQNVFYYKRQF